MLDPREEVRAQPLDLAGKGDLLHSREERLQGQPQFEACQMCTGAEMLALAERDVLVGRPPEVEGVGIVEHGLIAISGRKPQRDAVALANLPTAQFRVPGCDARKMSYRTRPAQNFLDRARHDFRMRAQQIQLRWMLEQGQQPR